MKSALCVLLSGPSCAGKTPLIKAFIRENPDKLIAKPVLITSREPRPNEGEGVDYFFRSETEITNLDRSRFIVAKTRHIWQAIDSIEILQLIANFEVVIFDIHPNLVHALLKFDHLSSAVKSRSVRVFLQPATLTEIQDMQRALGDASPQQATAAIMTPKLISRAQQYGLDLTPEVLRDIQIRAGRAWEEILLGQDYDRILVNHDGEESPHWQDSPPSGEAGKTLTKFAEIIQYYSA